MYISNNKQGVTLVETLFSVLILSLVIAGILLVFVHTVDISKRIKEEYIATNIAKNRLERSRTIKITGGFDSLPDLSETNTPTNAAGVYDAAGPYRRTTTVVDYVPTGYTGEEELTRVDVSVVYKYRNEWKTGIPVTMTTVFSDIE